MTAYDDTNIFAKILRGEIPAERLYEDADTLAIMDIMPRVAGHCLVLPKAGARNLFDIEPDSLAAVARTAQVMAKAVMVAFGADGVTVEQFNEAPAGQSVFHLHMHILPRHEGVALNPHMGAMEEADVLAANAEKIRAALGDQAAK